MNKEHVHSLRKHEIVRKKQLISLLFRCGKYVKGEFIKIVYTSVKTEGNCVQGVPAILFAVSKKTIPLAVHRNRVKRMMREAYRLEKSSGDRIEDRMTENRKSERLIISFLYTARKSAIPDLDAFRKEIRELMRNIRLS